MHDAPCGFERHPPRDADLAELFDQPVGAVGLGDGGGDGQLCRRRGRLANGVDADDNAIDIGSFNDGGGGFSVCIEEFDLLAEARAQDIPQMVGFGGGKRERADPYR